MKPAAFFALVCACFAFTPSAQAAIGVGVADDTLLGNPDGGASFLGVMNDIGLRELRIPLTWDSRRPATIAHQTQIHALMPVATLRGMRVVFSVQTRNAGALTASPEAPAEFVAFMQKVARSYPTVRDIVVGNEPNQPRFWQPQFDARGRNVSARAYGAVLAASYDALKQVDPAAQCDRPRPLLARQRQPARHPATSRPHRSSSFSSWALPTGRVAGRGRSWTSLPTTRIPGETRTRWPTASGGRTPARRTSTASSRRSGTRFTARARETFEDGLRVRLDEVGWQVAVPRAALHAYFGVENVKPTTEATQASIYASLVRHAACDPHVDALMFFGLRDEPNLARWQAGLMRADGTPRPSYSSLKNVIARTGGKCVGRMRSWRHATAVDGASATFRSERRLPRRVRSWSFLASADEDARFDAGIYRLRGRPSRRARARRDGALRRAPQAVRAFPIAAPGPRPLRLLDPLPRRGEPGSHDPPDQPPVRHLPRSLAASLGSGAPVVNGVDSAQYSR